jgi:hypothetical protein
MSQLVKTKANFNDFKRKGLVEQKNVVFNSFLCQLGFFGTRGPLKRSFHSHFKLTHSCQKQPIYTRTRQINFIDVLMLIFAYPSKPNNEQNMRKRNLFSSFFLSLKLIFIFFFNPS